MIKKVFRYMLKKLHSKLKELSENEPVFPVSEKIQIGPNFTIGKYRHILVEKEATIEIGEVVGFREFCNIIVHNGASLKIGKYVYCNNYVSINCLGKTTIGDYTLIGEGTKMYDHMHTYTFDKNGLIVDRLGWNYGEINIGKNVFIGCNCVILTGVTIGDNVMIGANNFIYKSVPANTIVKPKLESTLKSFEERR